MRQSVAVDLVLFNSMYRPIAVAAGRELSDEDVLLEVCDGEFEGEPDISSWW